jgi:hypothetical protein
MLGPFYFPLILVEKFSFLGLKYSVKTKEHLYMMALALDRFSVAFNRISYCLRLLAVGQLVSMLSFSVLHVLPGRTLTCCFFFLKKSLSLLTQQFILTVIYFANIRFRNRAVCDSFCDLHMFVWSCCSLYTAISSDIWAVAHPRYAGSFVVVDQTSKKILIWSLWIY